MAEIPKMRAASRVEATPLQSDTDNQAVTSRAKAIPLLKVATRAALAQRLELTPETAPDPDSPWNAPSRPPNLSELLEVADRLDGVDAPSVAEARIANSIRRAVGTASSLGSRDPSAEEVNEALVRRTLVRHRTGVDVLDLI